MTATRSEDQREVTARAVEPLARTTGDGQVLRRPARIETEIAAVLTLDRRALLARAALGDGDGGLSSECLVHLIRRDARRGGRSLVEALTPILLRRCDRQVHGAVRGFAAADRDEVCEEILGRVALLLAAAGDGADFFEVRFGLALKRLRIDVCRRHRRWRDRQVALADAGGGEDGDENAALDALAGAAARGRTAAPEARLLAREALAVLTEEERTVLLLHRLMGVSINARASSGPSLVSLLGVSERTVRNRLRRAEAKLAAWKEVAP